MKASGRTSTEGAAPAAPAREVEAASASETPRDALSALVAAELDRAPSPAARALADELLRRHGEACRAILYYGSGLRSGDAGDVVLDLLVVVDRYRDFYRKRWQALANSILAPNVFYLEAPLGERIVRAKYAVVSTALLERGTSTRTLQVYYWGRLSQPCLLVHARDASAREQTIRALAQAVTTFATLALPLAPPVFRAETLWETGLAASYRTELRAERKGQADRLVAHFGERCRRATHAALAPLASVSVEGDDRFRCELSRGRRRWARVVWRLRCVQGKTLHFLRLVKGLFTFEGGVDYILWKIERHSGVRVEPSDRARRYPLLFGWPTLWRLYRLGAFR